METPGGDSIGAGAGAGAGTMIGAGTTGGATTGATTTGATTMGAGGGVVSGVGIEGVLSVNESGSEILTLPATSRATTLTS